MYKILKEHNIEIDTLIQLIKYKRKNIKFHKDIDLIKNQN